MYTVELTKLIEKMNLENLTPEVGLEKIMITQADVNRPALQLTGFFDYFDNNRIQIIGHVENTYIERMWDVHGVSMLQKIMEQKVPCLVFCREIEVTEDVLALGREYGVPILRTKKTTSSFMAEVIRWLNVELAPRISIHGVLVDIYGEGVNVAARLEQLADPGSVYISGGGNRPATSWRLKKSATKRW